MEDDWLEARYDDQWYVDDAEEFERNQLALDNDFDGPYDDEDDEDYASDPWYDDQDEYV